MFSEDQLTAPRLIKGGSHRDHRGEVAFVNDCDLTAVKRFYRIVHHDLDTIRAWQGHQRESKIFCCVQGRFLIKTVEIDDWENPSPNLSCQSYILSAEQSSVLHIPPGYANGFQALSLDAQLLVFSDLTMEEAKGDDFRFDSGLWWEG